MSHVALLGPVVALVGWSLVMMVWMMAARLPRLRGKSLPNGGRGADLERTDPGPHHWPAHNYAHLMEQPTIFYAIVLALAAMGPNHLVDVALAWAYVVSRIAHSLVQATSNVIAVRFPLFLIGSLCLVALTIHAAISWIRLV